VRDLVWFNCIVVGGNTVNAAGIQMRGQNEAAINCRVYGCEWGVYFAAGSNNVVDGGLYVGNRFGIGVARSPNSKVKNFPRIVDSVNAHVTFDNVNIEAPFDQPFKGLSIEAEFSGVPLYGDVQCCQRNANYQPIFDPTWRFNCRADGRPVSYKVMLNDRTTPGNFAWPTEYGVGSATKFASWNVIPMTARYGMNSTPGALAVVATLPDPAASPVCRIRFRKVNTGGGACSLGGFPVDGIANPVIPDGGTMEVTNSVATFRIASVGNVYTDGSGAVLIKTLDPLPFLEGQRLTVSDVTGTGGFAGINGTFTSDPGTTGKQLRFHAAIGLGATTITGGLITIGGWGQV
jgi:hypothetical protein